MVVNVTHLETYVGADPDGDARALLTDFLEQAVALVDKYVGSVTVPEVILDQAYIAVGADLWNRRSAPNGVVNLQFANFGGDQAQAVRIARDPMKAAYPILGRWVTPWPLPEETT